MFCTYFNDNEVFDYNSAKTSDTKKFSRFFSGMLRRGINLAPSQFEAGFLSLAHTSKDIELTIRGAYQALKDV
jgi:glutamate-1-semialdehyde 2,1-aminomutase